MKRFSASITENLGFYVYMLIDPETDQVFYVGKGTGNRIFAHLEYAIKFPKESDKLDKIRQIRQKGFEVKHLIHRHGLTEKEAFEVEASLIDFIGLGLLTNKVAGNKSNDRGQMTAAEVIALYDAPIIEILEPALLITVNRLFRRGMDAPSLYEITRGNWVVGKRREKAKYAFAVYHGVVRQVYEIHHWFPVEARSPMQKTRQRWRFEGIVSSALQHYVGGSVENYISLGNQNPIKYVNC
ncbi:LEM-3-like GIY-YIG domain-containing protein [Candidatus Leptofilum sp.]|uniref:LEM-3-like GIY-YIG domain-containing protein n=1 Tax=Candidatus Leptofilum sp. TaxID=3241576 RepID=UPI003B5A4A8B